MRQFLPRSTSAAAFIMALLSSIPGQAMDIITDIEFAQVDGHTLSLDLYKPEGVENPPLIVWIHGGAWSFGSKADIHVRDIGTR